MTLYCDTEMLRDVEQTTGKTSLERQLLVLVALDPERNHRCGDTRGRHRMYLGN